MNSHSQAWISFRDSRLEVLDLLLGATRSSESLEKGRRLSRREAQLRFVVVALVGQLQAFASRLLEEVGDQLPNTWGAATPIQKRYVAVQLRRRLEELLPNYLEVDFAEARRVEQFVQSIAGCSEWQKTPATLSSSAERKELQGFLRDNSTKSLDRLFSHFQPQQMRFSDWLYSNFPGYRGVFNVLDDAIRVRNEVAHGQLNLRITGLDVRRYRVAIYRLINKIDEYVNIPSPTQTSATGKI